MANSQCEVINTAVNSSFPMTKSQSLLHAAYGCCHDAAHWHSLFHQGCHSLKSQRLSDTESLLTMMCRHSYDDQHAGIIHVK